MKSKRLSRILKVVCLIMLICTGIMLFNINQSYAADTDAKEPTDISMKDIMEAGYNWTNVKTDKDADYFVDQFITIGKVLVAIGVATLVIVTLIMAFKWIVATPDQQAKLKGQLVGLVISVIVIFGAVGIWNLARGIMNKVEEEELNPNAQSVVRYEDTMQTTRSTRNASNYII